MPGRLLPDPTENPEGLKDNRLPIRVGVPKSELSVSSYETEKPFPARLAVVAPALADTTAPAMAAASSLSFNVMQSASMSVY